MGAADDFFIDDKQLSEYFLNKTGKSLQGTKYGPLVDTIQSIWSRRKDLSEAEKPKIDSGISEREKLIREKLELERQSRPDRPEPEEPPKKLN